MRLTKRLASIVLFGLPFGLATLHGGGMIVYDPTVHNQLIADATKEETRDIRQHVENIKKWIESIKNQKQQIEQLQTQITQGDNLLRITGDPTRLIQMPLDQMMGQKGEGKDLKQLTTEAEGTTYVTKQSDVYQSLPATTDSGTTIEYKEDDYKRYAVVEDAATNYKTVAEKNSARLQQLREQISEDMKAINESQDHAEILKRTAALQAKTAEMDQIQREKDDAATQLLIQHFENENRKEAESRAAADKTKTELKETSKKYSDWTKSLKITPPNYTQ